MSDQPLESRNRFENSRQEGFVAAGTIGGQSQGRRRADRDANQGSSMGVRRDASGRESPTTGRGSWAAYRPECSRVPSSWRRSRSDTGSPRGSAPAEKTCPRAQRGATARPGQEWRALDWFFSSLNVQREYPRALPAQRWYGGHYFLGTRVMERARVGKRRHGRERKDPLRVASYCRGGLPGGHLRAALRPSRAIGGEVQDVLGVDPPGVFTGRSRVRRRRRVSRQGGGPLSQAVVLPGQRAPGTDCPGCWRSPDRSPG